MSSYRYFNMNPKGLRADDCAIRAIALASGREYNDVKKSLSSYKAITGAKRFYENKNLIYALNLLNARRIDSCRGMSIDEFCDKYRVGSYVLSIDGHFSAAIDGCVYDTWNVLGERLICAYELSGGSAPDLRNQTLRYCCTAEIGSDGNAQIKIYDGLGNFATRVVPKNYVEGYVRCLEDQNYIYVEL